MRRKKNIINTKPEDYLIHTPWKDNRDNLNTAQ
jgi:hypothetical protein